MAMAFAPLSIVLVKKYNAARGLISRDSAKNSLDKKVN